MVIEMGVMDWVYGSEAVYECPDCASTNIAEGRYDKYLCLDCGHLF
jgi:DNA-directed RNA polymerase subunit RPC12/RpoP